jgi:N-acetylmuramoyl-L-alanine amidase
LLLGALLLPSGGQASAAGGVLSGTKVCIDPGHGGSDPGAVNAAYGLHEAEINLDVSYALKALLVADGAEVVMTRTDDSYKSNGDRYDFCDAQAATILVSVHTNSVTDLTMDGSMALYFHADDKLLAQAIYDVMYPALRDSAPDPGAFTGFGLSKYASGVLLKSDMPAAMMEPLFMSNPAEASLLVSRVYVDQGQTPDPGCADLACRRGQIARSIYEGIVSYLGSGGTNLPPVASFASQCVGLECAFDGSASYDPEGTSLTYAWGFGDGGSASGEMASHTYASDGTYSVTLTVTDAQGATDSLTQDVTVSGGSGGIALLVTGYKVKGLQKADLQWSGATSSSVDVYRDGALIATTPNDGFYTDPIDARRGGSYLYVICEAGTDTCSNEVMVAF